MINGTNNNSEDIQYPINTQLVQDVDNVYNNHSFDLNVNFHKFSIVIKSKKK